MSNAVETKPYGAEEIESVPNNEKGHQHEHVDELKTAANFKADAIEAESAEHAMTVWEAAKAYPMACLWAFIMSSTIVSDVASVMNLLLTTADHGSLLRVLDGFVSRVWICADGQVIISPCQPSVTHSVSRTVVEERLSRQVGNPLSKWVVPSVPSSECSSLVL